MIRRKTGTATNSRIWNWWAVPGLPTAGTPPLAPPIFIPTDEVLPHNATDLCVSASRRGKTRPLSKMPDSCVCRKTGTATNSRLWNWLAVPGLPTADTPPVARPIFIPSDEASPHNATDTSSQTATAEISMQENVQWQRIPASAKLRAGPILGMAHQCIPADIRRKSKWRANELCQPTPAPPRAWPESSRCPSCFGA